MEKEVLEVHGYRFVKKRLVGEVEIELPDPPDLEDIDNHDKPVKEQKFRRTHMHTLAAYKKLTSDQRSEFLDRMWKYRREGFWFLNNGNIEYITGIHWFYLNCFINDEGTYMDFYDRDRDFWLLWDWVERNPQCTGLIFATGRRFGKTAKALCMLLEYATGEPFAHVGIQSKSESDSRTYFSRLVYSWTKMPFFFQPIHTGQKNPKTELVFAEPSVSSKKDISFEYYKVLNSKIDYVSSKEKAYDGQKLKRCLHDEAAKFEEGNAKKRYDVVKECLMRGKDIIGKILLTSTIEKATDVKSKTGMGAATENFKELWFKSDYTKLSENGRTETGLIRYFQSAAYGLQGFINEYGYSDVDAANEYIDRELDALTEEDAIAYRGRYPRSDEDMWGILEQDNGLDLNKIQEQKSWNKIHVNSTDNSNIKLQRGDFYWKDQFGGQVIWTPNPNGKFQVVWLPKIENTNQWFWKGEYRYPKNYLEGVIGVDPIDDISNNIDKPSNFALATYRIGGIQESMFNEAFVNIYCTRSTYPETHFEDALKCAIFYGYQICIEDNRTAFKNWLRERGFIGYLTPRPIETAPDSKILNELDFGIPTSAQRVRDLLFNYLAVYVYEHCGFDKSGQVGNVYIDDILTDWTKYKPSQKWTKYDLTVATLMALGGAKGSSRFRQPETTPVVLELPVYDARGNRSVQIRR